MTNAEFYWTSDIDQTYTALVRVYPLIEFLVYFIAVAQRVKGQRAVVVKGVLPVVPVQNTSDAVWHRTCGRKSAGLRRRTHGRVGQLRPGGKISEFLTGREHASKRKVAAQGHLSSVVTQNEGRSHARDSRSRAAVRVEFSPLLNLSPAAGLALLFLASGAANADVGPSVGDNPAHTPSPCIHTAQSRCMHRRTSGQYVGRRRLATVESHSPLLLNR